jgi:hypothetical protein
MAEQCLKPVVTRYSVRRPALAWDFGSLAVSGVSCTAERVECSVESLLVALVRLVIGLGGHEADHLVRILVVGRQDEG